MYHNTGANFFGKARKALFEPLFPPVQVLLGKRIVEPQPDWWFMGGRMRCGESPEASVVRLVKRELQLHLGGERFR